MLFNIVELRNVINKVNKDIEFREIYLSLTNFF